MFVDSSHFSNYMFGLHPRVQRFAQVQSTLMERENMCDMGLLSTIEKAILSLILCNRFVI